MALAKEISAGNRYWLLAYVGPGFYKSFVEDGTISRKDMVTIWRDAPAQPVGRFAIVVETIGEATPYLAVDLASISWSVNGQNIRTWKECRSFPNLEQAIMACSMLCG